MILRDAEIEGTSAINKIFRLGNTKIYLNRQRMGEVAVIAAQVGGAFGKLHSQIRSLLTLEPDVAAEAHTRLIELNVDVSTTLNSIIYGEMTNDEALSSLLDLIRKIEQAFDFSELDDENF
ncbi:hypothetical protein HJA_15976 [Hyphomonas jannaschiana VP2]|uniref:Uncharacterized protein n=1 Tax=Hyphomonas jannaschiana VP2 TaxID=1280952 RepID=A0A059F6N8_9PROT|nr:hypothetical protein HJA_15976 [Hyphomonas jannaschiana VP2]